VKRFRNSECDSNCHVMVMIRATRSCRQNLSEEKREANS
jgi:hypothetical protein